MESMESRQIELIRWLVEHNTESPPARNTDPLQDEIQAFLEELDFEVARFPLYENDSVIVGTLKGTDPEAPKLILNGHVDVASVDDDAFWEYPPFELTEEGDYVIGRGTSDMKGAFGSALYVLEKLHRAGKQPKGDIIIHSVVGEEVGEAGTKLACEHSPQADLALVFDTSNHQALGQGGVITGWITVQSKETIHDGARSQMVHAGGGLFGASAIEKMMKVIQALKELEQHWAVMKRYPGMPSGATTINPAVIEGGRHAAFIADECKLWITVHYLPNEDYEDVIAEIENYLNNVASGDVWLRENPLQFEWGGESMIEDCGEIFPSFTIPTEHPGFELLRECHEAVWDAELEQGVSTTVADGGWLHTYGIPTIMYGPGELSEAHSVDEKVKKHDLAQFARVIEQFLADWYDKPRK